MKTLLVLAAGKRMGGRARPCRIAPHDSATATLRSASKVSPAWMSLTPASRDRRLLQQFDLAIDPRPLDVAFRIAPREHFVRFDVLPAKDPARHALRQLG